MSEPELKSCPFCGYGEIRMRKKTQCRRTVTGLTYINTESILHPLYGGFIGTEQMERDCYDYRFAVRFYCGRCRCETPYVWGEWHLPTEDEAEEYDALPHCCERFDEEQECEAISRAMGIWNRRVAV